MNITFRQTKSERGSDTGGELSRRPTRGGTVILVDGGRTVMLGHHSKQGERSRRPSRTGLVVFIDVVYQIKWKTSIFPK